jgi:hypothetical protein
MHHTDDQNGILSNVAGVKQARPKDGDLTVGTAVGILRVWRATGVRWGREGRNKRLMPELVTTPFRV